MPSALPCRRAPVSAALPAEDRRILEEHTAPVRGFARELAARCGEIAHAVPVLGEGILDQNGHMPRISRMQIELVVASLAADFTRVATLQCTNSVGQPHMKWLGIDEGQHSLSHEPNTKADAQEKLTKINAWYAGEVAHLAQRLAKTPEPGGQGSLLDHTTILSTDELGEGNSIPTTTSPGCSSAAASASKPVGPCSFGACPTTGSWSRWPGRWATSR